MMRHLPDHGLMLAGHDTQRAEVLTLGRAALLELGVSAWDADEQLADRPGLLARCWWGGDDVGFVQEGHPGATPVTVVNVHKGG
jgi:hypothetical protein